MKLNGIAVVAVLISAAITATQDVSAQVIVPADNQPAVAPSPPVANPATYVASNSFTAKWSSVSGATGYLLDVSPNSSFSTYVTGYHNRDVGNAISRNVTLLNASTTYYYRVRAYNGAETSGYSNVVNVTTLSATGPPVVITNPASLVASFSATLNGSIDPHGLPTTVYFRWGTSNTYGNTTPPQNRNGNTFQNVFANITPLNANTTYHFRIVATNSAGTRVGSDRIFTTLSDTGPPVVITNPASLVASFSATLNSLVDPHGLPTTVHFQWGTTNTYGNNTLDQSKSGDTFQNVARNISSGLTPSTTYHFRIWAMNSAGTVHGVDRTFRTLSPTGSPVVITNPATNIATSSATLNGTVNPHGSPTTVHFQWGTTNTYGHNTPDQSRTGNTFQNVFSNISGLTTHTTYHFRIVATNSGGTGNGLDRIFTTLASPTVTPTPTSTPTPPPFTETPTPSPTPTFTPTPPPFTGTPTATPTPTATFGPYTISQIGGSIVPGTEDIGNHGDDTVTTISLPFFYRLYDVTFTTSINVSSNGNVQFLTNDTEFTNTCLPWTTHNYTIFPYWDDLYLVNSGFGIFTSISGTAPNRIFNIEWRAQYFPGTGTANFELRLYEGQTRFDVIYGTVTNGNTSATAGVQRENDGLHTEYFCNGSGGAASGGQSYIFQGTGTPTLTPTATASPTPTPTPVCTPSYAFFLGTGTLVPGINDIGNHCDDCSTVIALPFPVHLYGQTFTSAAAGSNGHLTFGTADDLYQTTCSPFGRSAATYVLAPYWADQCTAKCSTNCTGCGIFTTTTGIAPNRVFYVEYRTNYYSQTQPLNYEIALYESGTPPFQFIYGTINPATTANDSQLVAGVKLNNTTFTQYGCDTTGGQAPPVSSAQQLTAVQVGCASPSP